MKLGKIAKQILGTVAPLVATAVGGPFGGIASKLIKSALGVDSDSEVDQILATGDPEILLKLKNAEKEMDVEMRRLGIQEQDLYLKDTQSARDLAVKTGIGPQLTLAALFVGGYFVILVMVLSGWLTPSEGLKDMAMILIGVLAGEVPRIMSFFFGTTKGSSDKNAYLAAAQSINGGSK